MIFKLKKYIDAHILSTIIGGLIGLLFGYWVNANANDIKEEYNVTTDQSSG